MKKLLIVCLLVVGLMPTTGMFAQDPGKTPAPTTPNTEQVTTANDSTPSGVVGKVSEWYKQHMNYGTIAALMTVESSFIPFPSEIVIPPAAFVAANEDSDLNVTDSYLVNVILIVLFGTLGALLGAIINYLLSMWLGRAIIYKFADSKLGHLCLLNREKVEKAEKYFNERGKLSTFIGRLIPAIRQLISIPAGLSKMHFGSFVLYTFLGAFIWNSVLATFGYIAGGNQELIYKYSHELGAAIIVLLAVVILYFVIKKYIAHRRKKAA